jgi:membrane-bound lytic murein transglycosylase D
MRAVKVIFALFLGVTGIFGCSSTERLHHRTTTTVPFPQAETDVSDLSDSATGPSSFNLSASVIEPSVTDEQNPLTPAREVKASPLLEPVEPQLERMESAEKPAQTAKSSAPAAQSPPSLRTDNRLLELLERDLEKAVEQPKERRRLQFSKEVVDNPKVRHFVRYYATTGKIRFQQLLGRSGKYLPMIAKVLSQEGLPEELGYLALLESEFVVNTTSRNGAVGLWQFIAATARRYGLRIDEWVDERRDPVKSTRAAAAYLKDLHDYYGRWYLATAAYNAGPGNVDKALQQSGAKDFWHIKTKTQLTEETHNFVPKFVAISLIAMDPSKYGLNDVRYEAALDYEEVELKAPMKLAALAQSAETDIPDLRDLNPALLRDMTPPGEQSFRINVPVGKASILLAKTIEKPVEKNTEPTQVVTHEVKRGETLFSIARSYGLEVRALMEFNGLTTSRLLIGQRLRILLEGLRGVLR